MSLLLDENLSPRLLQRVSSLFPGMIHVRDVGLKQASDEGIWGWARRRSYTIVTTDADFAGLSRRLGWPPKVIHLEECDFPLRIIEELLRQNSVRISEFEKGSVTGLLGLRFAPPLRQGFPVSRRYVHVARKHFGVREEESGSTSHIGTTRQRRPNRSTFRVRRHPPGAAPSRTAVLQL